MATIYDVAKLAGVSPATVSRVLNGVPVSQSKADAVRRAAAELEFTPNRTARGLRMQTSEVIGLIIPDIANPYFTQVARGVEDAAQEAGYSVVLCNSDSDLLKEQRYMRIAVSQNMAGVVIAAAGGGPDLSVVTDAGRPVVAIDRANDFRVDAVVVANRDAGFMATEDLVKSGFKKIAFVSGPSEIDTARERVRGWREAIEKHVGSAPAADLLLISTFQVEGGRASVRELLDRDDRPDAVVLSNNLLGVGAMQVLLERGVTPAEFGVSVIGSLPFATLPPSTVSVLHLPARQMGVEAARLLIERLRGDAQPPRTIVLRGRLDSARSEA